MVHTEVAGAANDEGVCVFEPRRARRLGKGVVRRQGDAQAVESPLDARLLVGGQRGARLASLDEEQTGGHGREHLVQILENRNRRKPRDRSLLIEKQDLADVRAPLRLHVDARAAFR